MVHYQIVAGTSTHQCAFYGQLYTWYTVQFDVDLSQMTERLPLLCNIEEEE